MEHDKLPQLHTTVFKFIRVTKDKAKNVICLKHGLIFVEVYGVFSTLKSTKFISVHIDITSYV